MKYKIKSAFQKFATTAITLSGVMTAAGITLSAQSAQALTFFSSNFTNYSNVTGSSNNTVNLNQYTPLATQQVTEVRIILNNTTLNGSINVKNTGGGNNRLYNVRQNLNGYNIEPGSNAPASPDPLDSLTPFPTQTGTTVNGAYIGTLSGLNSERTFIFPAIISDTSTYTQFYTTFSDISSFLGAGTVSFNVSPDLQLVSSSNSNITATNTYNTSGTLTVEYYGNITPVPFEFSPGLSIPIFGGVFYGMSRWKRNRHLKSVKLP
ncbi:hypothetical protein [Anabaena catenula]|uniref:PEP-CTERM sorting domain-containing protein n=1 Tax=Anabaena catenula FACHB-362 TaxID=2692877 RepID=A0ABR8IX16_9NOST|nr:hypothetical protein [Anabaena catenula]MBD2690606.1 hypothetical protein [Anabaena catenula FACHB-362]